MAPIKGTRRVLVDYMILSCMQKDTGDSGFGSWDAFAILLVAI